MQFHQRIAERARQRQRRSHRAHGDLFRSGAIHDEPAYQNVVASLDNHASREIDGARDREGGLTDQTEKQSRCCSPPCAGKSTSHFIRVAPQEKLSRAEGRLICEAKNEQISDRSMAGFRFIYGATSPVTNPALWNPIFRQKSRFLSGPAGA